MLKWLVRASVRVAREVQVAHGWAVRRVRRIIGERAHTERISKFHPLLL